MALTCKHSYVRSLQDSRLEGAKHETKEQTTIYSNFHAYNALAHFSGVSQNAWSLLPGPP